MPWRLKLYPTSEACFDAHRGGVPIAHGWRGPDGVVFFATPGGFCNLGAHTITGEGDQLTASPSILVSNAEGPKYHGWLQNGILTDDCDGRKFPEWPSTA